MGWLQSLATEFGITVSDGTVWLSIGEGLLFGAVCLVFGVWVARFVGLLESDAPAGETLGVGLASGLLVLASWWAAVASGGRSSFTPVAVGFVIAIALALVRRLRQTDHGTVEMPAMAPAHRRNLIVARRWRRLCSWSRWRCFMARRITPQPARRRPAARVQRRGVLLGPWSGPRTDRDRVDLFAIGI